MVNETNIVSLILDKPVQPGPSFQVPQLEANDHQRFDQVLQARADSPEAKDKPVASPAFEAEANRAAENSRHQAPVSYDEEPAPVKSDNNSNPAAPASDRRDSAPLNDAPRTNSSDPAPKEPVNPFTLPLEQLEKGLIPADNANPSAVEAVEVLAGLVGTQGLHEEGSPSIDTLKELLASLNIDSETIDQLVDALQNGDAAGLQGILNALRGLLHAATQVAPGAEILPDAAANRLSQPEQLALNLLIRAGLTGEEAQQVIQQARTANSGQPLTENTAQFAKTSADALAAKPHSENSGGSGNLHNSTRDSNGSAKNSSEGPRNVTGLAGDRLETLASLVSPDKAGNAQTNPLITRVAGSPLLNLMQPSGQPAPGILAEGMPGQAPAALADAAAKAVEFARPAITETYTGRASMEKPITAQIIEKFTMRSFGNQREIHIKLDPPSLGTVRMNVSTSGEMVRATIIAENNLVKSVIESNLSQLKDSLAQQGVKVDSFNVWVGGNASHSAQEHQAGLDYLGQLGREGSMAHEQAEEIVTLHRPAFLYENQSISIFA